jgi:PPOX class probable F420-dependent enzyme
VLSRGDLEFIMGRRVAHLATTDAAGIPHVAPVCFAYNDGRFWIAIDEKPKRTLRLKRLRNIEENPNVALVFDRYDDDWSRLGYVMVRGRASIMDRGLEYERALATLRERYPQYEAMRLEERPVIRIDPERVVRWGDLR